MKIKAASLISMLIVVSLLFSLTACKANDSADSAATADVQALLKEEMKKLKFYGVARLSKDGEVYEAANGTVTRDGSEEISADSQFAIGSVSKQFTAACIMLLKEDGKLSVDDTIDKWFPDYTYGSEITVKNLLTMRSGVRDYVNGADAEDEYFKRYNFAEDATEEENRSATRNWIFSKELDFQPDSSAAYSNSNYFLLAEIVEKASQKSFSEYLKEKLLLPLEMNDTGVAEELSGSARLVPQAYDGEPSEIKTKGIAFGDGGIISTAADMDKWMTSLREHTVLSKEILDEMTTDYSPDSSLHYGYGFIVGSDGSISHEGEIDSYFTHEFTVQGEKYNLFIATNRSQYQKMSELASYIKYKTR